MSVKAKARKQYQAIIDQAAAGKVEDLPRPTEGWIASARKALGLSAAQLGRIVARTRANISAAEQSEQNERATLHTMKVLAEAMGCKFVYAIVPAQGRIEDVLQRQALNKARGFVERASTHMALEKQALSQAAREEEIERLAQEMLRNPPPDFWENE
jgi:predicted DNA-binding mobile mystery protein A